MTCGRGGTGRRAALRSLWPKGRGSSSLLDRTSMQSLRRCDTQAIGGDARLQPSLDRSQADHRMLGRDLERNAEIRHDSSGSRRGRTDAQPVRTVGHALKQEEAIEVGAGGPDDLARTVDQLEIDAFEAKLAT